MLLQYYLQYMLKQISQLTMAPLWLLLFGEYPPFVDKTYEYFENVLIKSNNLPLELQTPNEWTEEYIPWEEQTRCKKWN